MLTGHEYALAERSSAHCTVRNIRSVLQRAHHRHTWVNTTVSMAALYGRRHAPTVPPQTSLPADYKLVKPVPSLVLLDFTPVDASIDMGDMLEIVEKQPEIPADIMARVRAFVPPPPKHGPRLPRTFGSGPTMVPLAEVAPIIECTAPAAEEFGMVEKTVTVVKKSVLVQLKVTQ
ncbi:hypothetical protein GGF32_007477 [Allomyces javanicus]|nr:hypothetical protein GGF32_007477 [Allomyces javanicus]